MKDVPEYPHAEPWDIATQARMEYKSIGFYCTVNPLKRYGPLRTFGIRMVTELPGVADGATVRLAGQAENLEQRSFHNGKRSLSFNMTDATGQWPVRVYARDIDDLLFTMTRGLPIFIRGRFAAPCTYDDDGNEVNRRDPIRLYEAGLLLDALREESYELRIRLPLVSISDAKVVTLLRDLSCFPGRVRVILCPQLRNGTEVPVPTQLRVDLSDEMFARIEHAFGEACELRASVE